MFQKLAQMKKLQNSIIFLLKITINFDVIDRSLLRWFLKDHLGDFKTFVLVEMCLHTILNFQFLMENVIFVITIKRSPEEQYKYK